MQQPSVDRSWTGILLVLALRPGTSMATGPGTGTFSHRTAKNMQDAFQSAFSLAAFDLHDD
jgi:hypothetical protein